MPTKRLLVLRGGALGDFILTLPAIRALLAAHPGASLDLVANPSVAAIARDAFPVRAIRSLDDPALARFFVRGTDLPPATRDYFAHADVIVSYLHDPGEVFETNVRRCSAARYVRGPAKITGSIHASEQLSAPARELGITIDDWRPQLRFSTATRQKAQQRLGMKPDLTLHPGSGSPRKNWPLERWGLLIARFLEDGQNIAVIGGEADRAEMTYLQDKFRGQHVRFALNWPLPQLGPLLANSLFVGHDSGVSHLAAAAHARACVVLFGPTDPLVWSPRGENVQVLRAPGGDLNALPWERVCEAARAAIT